MKRALLFAAVAILLAAISLYWLRQHQAAARRLAEWEAERAEELISTVLADYWKWDRADLTLGEFAEEVAARSELPVEFDQAATVKKAPRELKVTVPDGIFSIDEMLRIALAQVSLKATIRDRKIVIAGGNLLERGGLRTVVYPLPQPKPVGMNESDWQALLQANIDGWAEAVPGAVIVVAEVTGQKRARLVIDTICGLRDQGPAVVAVPGPSGDMERHIRSELDQPTTIDFVEMPLKDVMLYLTDRHDIPLIVLADKLREASVSVNTPITKKLSDISLRSALNLILKDLELTFALRDQAVVITTPEDAEARLRTVAYAVDDLLAVNEGADLTALEKLVVTTIDPGSWRVFGGPAQTHRVDGRWLICEQTHEVGDKVEALLETLRRLLATSEYSAAHSIGADGDANERIRAALLRPIELDFEDVLVKDVVISLSELLNIPIVMSFKKMEEASISPDTPITFKTAPIPARLALEQLLKTTALDFVIRDSVLQITTPEDTESMLVTRVYDTRAILAHVDEQTLRKRIFDSIQPNSWCDVARGPGEAEFYRGVLIVSQTDRVHEEVEQLIEKLTAELAQQDKQ